MEVSTFVGSAKVKITLIKTQKGYRWAVEVTHEDDDEALRIIQKIVSEFEKLYG